MRLLMFAIVLLSLAAPALADEGGGDGADQPITTESSAPSAQAQESIVEGYRLVSASTGTGGRSIGPWFGAVLGGVGGVAIGGTLGLLVCELAGGGIDYFGCIFPSLTLGIIGLPVGAIKGWRASSGEDRQVSLSPYRHDDASGLMFSGQF
jgi:hypothetical protein